MKQTVVKGHSLTEQELKEVKGGMWYIIEPNGKLPEVPFPCEECGHSIEELLYNGRYFYGICEVCGSRKEIIMEE